MDTFEGEKPITSIHPTAKIDPSVKIPEGCRLVHMSLLRKELN